MNKDITLEDLGYTQFDYRDKANQFIEYKKLEKGIEKKIVFDIFLKEIEFNHSFRDCSINMEELQAIYNKCKELKWVDLIERGKNEI